MPHTAKFLTPALFLLVFLTVRSGYAQQPDGETLMTVSKGSSVLITARAPVQRISVGNPDIADGVVVSTREVVVNAKDFGTTTVMVWTTEPHLTVYTIEVTPDAAGTERDLHRLLPHDSLRVSARGRALVISGTARSAESAARAIELAQAGMQGQVVIDNISAPAAVQVMLSVQVAEVNRSAGLELEAALSALNPKKLDGKGDLTVESLSGEIMHFFMLDAAAQLDVTINALRSRGLFKTLAEPNLLTLPGREASFLAGGLFPFPVVRGTAENQNVTIEFREFGVRLKFTPTITSTGLIRLKVAPEVSSLDFANGLRFGGFLIPTVLTRRAETEVELREGQFLAIAGLSNDEIRNTVDRVPLLGDIPLLGLLFQNRSQRQNRNELLVIVTPRLVSPSDVAPWLPAGPSAPWEWSASLKKPAAKRP